MTKLSHEMSKSYLKLLSEVTVDGFRAEVRPLREGCLEVMKKSLGVGPQVPLNITYEADLRYKGQVNDFPFLSICVFN